MYSQAVVNVYGHWLTELRKEGFEENTDLKGFIELINKTAAKQHPIHVRHIDFIAVNQTGTPLDLASELAAKTVTAEWESWGKEATILHFFTVKVKCEESSKLAHKLLWENPAGDYKALVSELQVIQTTPWNYEEKGRTKAVKEGISGPVTC